MNSQTILELAARQIVQLSVAIVAVGAVTRLLCRRRPHLAYVLWMLVLVKALTPPVWSSRSGVFSWTAGHDDVVPAAIAPEHFALPDIAPAANPVVEQSAAPVRGSWSLPQILLAVWAGGASCILIAAATYSWAIRRRIARSSSPLSRELTETMESLCRRLGMRAGASVRVCDEPIGPAVVGIFRPTVVLPTAVLGDNDGAILAHELIHLRRKDPLAAGAQLLSVAVWWFNPLVWWMNRNISRVREMCCDAEVIGGLQYPAADYAQTLIDVLRQRRRFGAMMLAPGIRPAEVTARRLDGIISGTGWTHRRMPWRYWAVAALCALLLLPGARPGSAQTDQPETAPAQQVESVTHFVRLVIDEDSMSFQGETVPDEKLLDAMMAVPDRSNTVLELAYASWDVTMGRYEKVKGEFLNDRAREQLGFKYINDIGQKPLGSMGSPDATVYRRPPQAPQSELTHVVQFETGRTQFTGGDNLTITEVRGTSDTIEVGGTYQVTGTYRLASHDSASLQLQETSSDPRHFPEGQMQAMDVSRGDGTFTLTGVMVSKDGKPHVSFYAGGYSIGGVYFGTGDSVYRGR
jgi:beta-lactamase regulating signal transducer with metallopeptidase domain